MTTYPTKLSLDTNAVLVIEWSDGATCRYEAAELRRRCPCATCKEAEAAGRNDVAAAGRPITIAEVHPVGRYAYNICFNDGHETGIYPLTLLRDLGHREETP